LSKFITPTDKLCKEWFRRFKDGDFNVEDKSRSGQPKKFEDKELETLLEEDQSQTQEELAESLAGGYSTSRFCTSHGNDSETRKLDAMKPRDVKRRFFTCEQLIQRQQRKGFLHRIVIGNEKYIFYDNPKKKKYYAKPVNRCHRSQHQHHGTFMI